MMLPPGWFVDDEEIEMLLIFGIGLGLFALICQSVVSFG